MKNLVVILVILALLGSDAALGQPVTIRGRIIDILNEEDLAAPDISSYITGAVASGKVRNHAELRGAA